jgi:ABC-2 type transport system ATP-binding protein
MIRIENLVKHYGAVHALDGLSLNVEAGVVYGFLGPNGAGKTTTMRILTGLARSDEGRAWILDKKIGQSGIDVRNLIGVLPEEPVFYPWMTAREYLRDFVARLYRLDAATARKRTDELLNTVGLKEARNRRIGGFSRGMRQRLGLAQALIHNPPVLLLDEPVSALDPAGRKEVLELIESLRGKTTILLSTHILADVERVCDVVGIINKGRLIVQEQREELLRQYTTPIFEIELDNGAAQWIERARQFPFVETLTFENPTIRVLVKDIRTAQKILLDSLAAEDLLVRRFEILHPSLEDVFLRLTRKGA